MKHYTKKELGELEKLKRVNLINTVSGYKPANLIGTISAAKQTNLAIFSSVVHLGTNPPLFGFITRPTMEVPRHTYEKHKGNGSLHDQSRRRIVHRKRALYVGEIRPRKRRNLRLAD